MQDKTEQTKNHKQIGLIYWLTRDFALFWKNVGVNNSS